MMLNCKKSVTFVIVMLLNITVAFAQYNMLFTSDYDLPNSLVNKVVEDKNGMVWVATEDGLCRFNGSRFVTYLNKTGDSHSLGSNFVRTVFASESGDVIVGSTSGVQVYKPGKNEFSEVLESKKDGVSGGNVNDIVAWKDGKLLVFGNVCFTLKKNDDKENWSVEKNVLTGKVKDAYRGVVAKDGSIWVARVADDVLCVSKDGKMRKVRSEDGGMCNTTSFCVAPDGRLFIGTADSGIFVYSDKTKAFHHIAGTENWKQIFDIGVMPGTSNLCVATDGNGIQMIDYRTGLIMSSQQFADPMIDMLHQKVHSLYINKSGDVWCALYQKGIFLACRQMNVFAYIGHRSSQYNLIGDCCVISLMQTRDGNIWATTDNGGLYGFTSGLTALREFLSGNSGDNGGVPSTMLGLYEDSKGRVWFGSHGSGGGMIDLNSGKCRYVGIKGVDRKDYSIYSYAEDKRGQMWVASMGDGILKYDEKEEMYVKCKGDNGCMWSNVIFYDKKHDRLYCGTYSGLVSFPASNPKQATQVEAESVVYAISGMSDHELSVATNKGLLLVDTNTGKIRKITTEQGLPSDNVYDSKMGNDGHLWISSSKGLTRLDLKTMTTETYTMRDGLQGNEFYKNTGLVTKDGRLLFGGTNGITAFQPRDVDKTQNSCKVRVVDVRAGEVYLAADEDGNYIVPSGIDAFTISFGTLPLYMTKRVTYSYSMDGGEWVILAAPQNKIAFSSLGYGNHVLRVKTTIDGKDSEVTETEIYVRYPWYLKWWTVIIWIGLLCALGYYIYINVMRRRNLRDRLLKHKQEQEMKESKLQFFMNIVHDLRTPLTLIATPLQKLMANDGDAGRQHLYGVMKRNTDRLVTLTNEIMDLRKLDRGKMELDLHAVHVSALIRSIVGNMEDIAQTRHQALSMTDNSDGKQMMMLDSQAFEKILTNLLSNALKYTQEGGEIAVEWNVRPSSSTKGDNEKTSLVLSVTDNGIGIADDEKKRIFERFYQVRVNDKHVKGTGIGLNLVKALVDLFGGEISVSDNPDGKGTRFTVVIESPKEGAISVSTKEALLPTAQSEEDLDSLDGDNSNEQNKYSWEDQEGSSPYGGIEGSSCQGRDASSPKGPSSRSSILIIDDDDDIRNFLCEELSGIYNVLEATDGKKAYEMLNKEKVDLVVSDVMMPEIDGIELTKMIRKNVRLSHLPIILLTAKTSDQDRLEGLQTTADAYVTKPFNLELLETLIGNLIMRHDKLRNTYSGNELPADKIETPEVQSADDKLMERLLKVINENLANPDLTSEMLAREVGLSRVHMYRKLKELTNQSATNYIRNIRLTKAAELLKQGNATVSEVAYLVGFRTPAHFSTAFKELYGVSPKEYKDPPKQ